MIHLSYFFLFLAISCYTLSFFQTLVVIAAFIHSLVYKNNMKKVVDFTLPLIIICAGNVSLFVSWILK